VNFWSENPECIPEGEIAPDREGHSIVQTENGKMATRVSWAEDYQGGSYGVLHSYGNGRESFYVK